jgi:tripartite ATP-independent transporter DctM subunit
MLRWSDNVPLALFMLPSIFLLIFLGVPVALALMSVAFAFGYAVFGNNIGLQFFGRVVELSNNYVLAAIPLFIFMGAILEHSGIARKLFDATKLWLGRLPGGLGLTAIVMCSIFAATSGLVGAAEIVVGMMAIPAMVKAGYRKDLIAGTICAGGSLGTMIPPSVIVVIYASIADLSVGDLFAGMVIPSGIMVALFITWVVGISWYNPAIAPKPSAEEFDMPLSRKLVITATALVPCLTLILAVLGSIFAGVASPTEAAAVGAVGALILTVIYGGFSWAMLADALHRTILITAMTILIILGGLMFTSVFLVNGGAQMVKDAIAYSNLGKEGTVGLFLLIVMLLGFVIDWISIILITVPIFAIIIKDLGINPVWFGVLMCIALQTSYLTPPMAPSIFYLRSIAPKDMTYGDMYRGVIPFVIMQLMTLAAVAAFPWTATYLADKLFRF